MRTPRYPSNCKADEPSITTASKADKLSREGFGEDEAEARRPAMVTRFLLGEEQKRSRRRTPKSSRQS